MDDYELPGSGKNDEFPTGAKRDSQDNKPRFDLIDEKFLYNLAIHLKRGADKYGEDNWRKGIALSRYKASLLRHIYAIFLDEDPKEDHVSAVVFNLMAMVATARMINDGELPQELGDIDEIFNYI